MRSWINLLRDKIYIFLFVGLVLVFFYPFILKGKIPIPADTIVGMYHPWRDVMWDHYSTGVPFKNFLITDPVRQQYIWRKTAIEQMKKGELPLWNPYAFSGTPLMANFQTAAFYPLNILFFIFSFNIAWGILILLQPIFAGLFLYLYLRFIKVNQQGSFIGAIAFSFSGFTISWLEWNTIIHTALWFPLVLLSIEKIASHLSSKKMILWSGIFTFSLASSFFAGHLQIFFYGLLLVVAYIFIRVISLRQDKIKIILLFTLCFLLFIIITSIQWLATLQFILLSARNFDQGSFIKLGWFIPWQNLVQLLAPDFFGNPTTGNYWGVWNYGEFVSYIGVIPLILALCALILRRDNKTWFFSGVILTSLLFALPTFLAQLPYRWQIPLISTSQPTRLLFLIDLSLGILAGLGFDWLCKNLNNSKFFQKLFKIIISLGIILIILWISVIIAPFSIKSVPIDNLSVAKRNLILPSGLILSIFVLYFVHLSSERKKYATTIIYFFILLITIFDIFRYGWKFTPFVKEEWIFPTTKTIEFLKSQKGPFRFMATDRKIFPPNFAAFYRLEDVSGYDPLYLINYGELVAAWNRGTSDIINPSAFNRILTPQDYSSRIADLFNVKYILSLRDEFSPKLKLVFQEGETRVYENKYTFPRAFLVYDYKIARNKQEVINLIFDETIDLRKTAIFEQDPGIELDGNDKENKVEIVSYEPEKIVLNTVSSKPAILILGDNFYPNWQVSIDGEKAILFKVDFTFRGVIVSKGERIVEFRIGWL